MRLLSLCLALSVWSGSAVAQDPVDDDQLLERIEAACAKLRADGRTVPLERLREGCDGRRCALELAAPQRGEGASPRPREVRRRLLRSTCVVGHHYRCEECRDWHFSASTGFAVGRDGAIATCYHLLVDAPDMPDATLVVADWTGAVHPVTEVLAADRAHDLCVLRCAAALEPLPIGADAEAGDPVFCLSNPDHVFATFTSGRVARRYVLRGVAPGTEADPGAPQLTTGPEHAQRSRPGLRKLEFLQVTCAFAAGSSGAPIVDERGALVGIAQSTSTILADPEATPAEAQMILWTAVPVAALRALFGPAEGERERR